MSEEELQRSVEKNGVQGKGFDERAYRTVFNALKKEPSYALPFNFADRVLQRIEAAAEQSTRRELIWFYLGLTAFVAVAGVAVALTGFKINFGVLKFISGYPGLFIFGTAFIMGLHWIDRKVIKKHTV